jgi:hypothetical protein
MDKFKIVDAEGDPDNPTEITIAVVDIKLGEGTLSYDVKEMLNDLIANSGWAMAVEQVDD